MRSSAPSTGLMSLTMLDDSELDAVAGGGANWGACAGDALAWGAGGAIAGSATGGGAAIGFLGGAGASIATDPNCWDGQQGMAAAAGQGVQDWWNGSGASAGGGDYGGGDSGGGDYGY